MALLDELGLGDAFLELPHRRVRRLEGTFADGTFTAADFGRLPGRHRYIAVVPQWDFLDFLAGHAERYPGFTLLRSTEADGLLRAGTAGAPDGGPVAGVSASGPGGAVEVRARLTVACDGRRSTVRRLLGLTPREFGAPMDVLWFRLPRRPDDPEGLGLRVGAGRLVVLIDRGDYFQSAYVIPKGGWEAAVAAGLEELRDGVAALAPFLADRVGAVRSWDDVKVLAVRVDRLRRWWAPGVLLLGDAAHAMSPIGGVGINLAVQDAVAAARLLTGPLAAGSGPLPPWRLARVQARRWFPTVATQLLQRLLQRVVLAPVLGATGPVWAPAGVRLVDRVPALQGLTARLVGLGLLPEHVDGTFPPRGKPVRRRGRPVRRRGKVACRATDPR